MITTFEKRPKLRFSLRTLFVITTAAAFLTCCFVYLIQPARQSSPDKSTYWLDQFHNGTERERETAANIIATYVRKGRANQPMIDVLFEAAIDKNANIRSAAVLGLDKTANGNKRAGSVLQQLADGDPDDDIRSMARQALTRGIP